MVRFVKPHAMRVLWPMITPGTPEKPKPETSNAQLRHDDRHLQADLVPDAGQIGAEVRIVRQQRHPALGQVPRDDPRVRPDALAGVADQRAHRLDDAVDLVPFDRRRW